MDLFEFGDGNINAIKIKKITIQNYRNIDFKEIALNDKGVVLKGKNGIGKTNIIEAVYWVLTDKLFSGVSKSYAQRITPVTAEKGAKTSVKIEFDVNTFVIEKILYEKYGKEDEYQGVETVYYINGSLTKSKQATERIKTYLGIEKFEEDYQGTNLSDIDTLALFYNLNYLDQIDYQVLRSIVIDIVGDINPIEVIKRSNGKYDVLLKSLEQNDMDVSLVKKAFRTEKFGGKGKDGLEQQIAVLTGTVQELETMGNQAVDKEQIEEAKAKLDTIDDEIAQLTVGQQKEQDGLLNELKLKIAEKRNEIAEAEKDIREKHEQSIDTKELDKQINEKNETLYDMRTLRQEKIGEIAELNSVIKDKIITGRSNKTEIETLTAKREKLVAEWKTLKSGGEKITCPLCHGEFNLKDDKRLTEIDVEGKSIRVRLDELTESNETIRIEIEKKNGEIVRIQKDVEQIDKNGIALGNEKKELEKERDEKRAKAGTVNLNVEPLATLRVDMHRLENELNTIGLDVTIAKQKMSSKVETLKVEKQQCQEIISKVNTRDSYIENAKAKREQLSKLHFKLTEVEEAIILSAELEKDIYKSIDKKIEDKFGENIRFELYKQNLDGTYDTRVCEMLVKDRWGNFVNYKTTNTGLKPIRAIEFVKTIKKHYEMLDGFVFVDELGSLDTESRQELFAFGEQVIATDVGENSKIEVKEN